MDSEAKPQHECQKRELHPLLAAFRLAVPHPAHSHAKLMHRGRNFAGL